MPATRARRLAAIPAAPAVRTLAVAALAVALLAAAGAAACASSPATRGAIDDGTTGLPVTTRIDGGAAGAAELRTFSTGPSTAEVGVAAAPEKVFTVLPGVYEALGVPINTLRTDGNTIGARDTRMPRRLGKVALSQYVDCGQNVTGTPNADAYAVTMSVLTRVAPADSGRSTVVTQVAATARPITVSGNTIQCSSTGRLENALNSAVAAQVAR